MKPIILPDLRQFHCISSRSVLIEYLTLPSLEELQIEYHIGTLSVGPFQAVPALLKRSECSLKALEICGNLWHFDSDILNVLMAASTIEQLSLKIRVDKPGTSSTTLRFIISRLTNQADAAPCLCPNLLSIELQFQNEQLFDVSLYVDMIESRWRVDTTSFGGVSRLRRVRLGIGKSSDGSEGEIERLLVMEEEGLDFRFH